MSADPLQRRYQDALKALTSMEDAGFAARLAGGCVRDRALGHVPSDYDIATDAKPEEVMKLFRAKRFKVVPTGIAHGTVTLVMPSGPVEITTLRVDVETDGRHATVVYGSSFEEDAARRDFTMNALYEDARGQIYDYHQGLQDLKAGILRFVGAPEQRIAEDYLRILRCFRFWARFGFKLAPGTLEAIAATRSGLLRLSQERITTELVKMLAAPAAPAALRAMQTSGVWELVVPELKNLGQKLSAVADDAFVPLTTVASEQRGIAALAVLAQMLPDLLSPQGAQALGERLRLATVDVKRLRFAIEAPTKLASLQREPAAALAFVDDAETMGGLGGFANFFCPVITLAVKAWPAARKNLVLEALRQVETTEANFGHRRVARLPIDGALLMRQLKLSPGPELGELLERLKRAYRNGEWETAEQGLDWLQRQPR